MAARCRITRWPAAGLALTMLAGPLVLARAADAAPVACPAYADGRSRGAVAVAGLEEASGLAAGRANAGILWTHADSGAGTLLYALDAADAGLVATFSLTGATNVDWEDIAVGPGPEPGLSYLYVGDTGDRGGRAEDPIVYRVPEPVVDPADGPGPQALPGVVALPFTYPDGLHDAETLLADPITGDLFIVTKNPLFTAGPSSVYRFPAPHTGADTELEWVAELDFSSAPLLGQLTTGGDISPSGDEILVRTYTGASVWRRAAGATVAAALAGPPCPVPVRSEPQGEAVGYAADGRSYFTVSEQRDQGPRPLYEFERAPQPDGRVRRGGSGRSVGDNIYNTTGARQTRHGDGGPGRSVTYFVSAQNDAPFPDRLRLRGAGSTRRFTVRYRNPAGVDITGQVQAGSYRTPNLAPGAIHTIRAEVTVHLTAPRDSSLARTVTIRSSLDRTRRDAVAFVTHRR